jgi:CRP-like cAMP-binding protein
MILPEEMEDIEFLQNLGPMWAGQVAALAQLKECPAGTVLFHEGRDASFIYLLLQGTVSLEIEVWPSKTVHAQTVGPGQVLGWSPVLGQGPMTATAITTARCRLAAIPINRLLHLCERDPHFGMALMQQIAVAVSQRLKAARFRLCGAERVRQAHAVPGAAHPVADGAD